MSTKYSMDYKYLCLSILLAISPFSSADASTNASKEIYTYDNFKFYRIEGSEDDIDNVFGDLADNISNFYEDFFYGGANTDGNLTYYTILIPPKYQKAFEEIVDNDHVTRILLANDFIEYVKSEQATPGSEFSWDAYYDVDSIFKFLNKTSASHSHNAKVVVGGRSYEGRKIWGLRIKSGAKSKPAFFIQSGIHAREWITPAVATYFINQLLTSTDPQIIAMRNQFDWYIFPTVNPDGYQYSFTKDRFWRKSRSLSPSGCHGVDLNRNWDTENWSVYSSSNDSCNYQFYVGTKPFSEPETRSLSKYIASIKNLRAYVTMHSAAQSLFIPYAGSDEKVDNYDDLIQIGNVSLAYGYRVNGAEYWGPTTARASGESIDWAKRTLKVPIVFEYELRGDLFDWPPSKIYQQGDEFTQMILGLVTEANNLKYF